MVGIIEVERPIYSGCPPRPLTYLVLTSHPPPSRHVPIMNPFGVPPLRQAPWNNFNGSHLSSNVCAPSSLHQKRPLFSSSPSKFFQFDAWSRDLVPDSQPAGSLNSAAISFQRHSRGPMDMSGSHSRTVPQRRSYVVWTTFHRRTQGPSSKINQILFNHPHPSCAAI